MEGFEESIPKAQTNEHKHQPEQQELGLGFQSSHSSDHDPAFNLPPPPPQPPDDLVQKTTDEEEEENQLIANRKIQNRQPINEEVQTQPPINEEFQNQQSFDEELLYGQIISVELENLVLAEETVSKKIMDEKGDVERAGNEANEYTDREVEVGVKGGNDDGNAKYEHGNDAICDKDEDAGSENEKEDDSGKEGVGEETLMLEGSKDGENKRFHYPLRPDAEDCSFYLRTGMCKFGSNCKFNHPTGRKNQDVKERVMEREENYERQGQTECKYYLTSGGCKFGKSCRYSHGKGKVPVAPIVEFNFLGLPIRPGEKECPFYMRNGSCKYGQNCKFNHPDPIAAGVGDSTSAYGHGGSVSLRGASPANAPSWSSPKTLNETSSFVPVMLSPTHGVPAPNLEWNVYQASVYQAPERRLPTPPAFALNNPADPNFYIYNKQQLLVDEFPERPGQPECSYFLKTGNCKYKSGCKFHHPKDRILKASTCALSEKGLPLRPDQNICSHYSRYGICKFGPACKFDHPENHTQSTSVSGLHKPGVLSNSVTDDEATNEWE